jgi:predicted PurR-regulated permease PerM
MSQDEKSGRFRNEILLVFALGIGCYAAWLVRDFLVLLYVSALFAVVLTPVVGAIAQFRIRRWQPFRRCALPVLLLGAAAAVLLFGFLALPPVIRDLQEFAREAPARLPAITERLRQVPFASQLNSPENLGKLQDFVSSAATRLLYSIGDWASGLLTIATGFVLTIYFILEGDHAYRWFLSFFAPAHRERLDRTLRTAEVRMGKWLVGQASLMLILGLLSTIVYVSLGVRYAYALGVLTGALNFIPVLGAAVSIALALLVAAVDSWGRALGILIFYAIYLQVENTVLTPRIMKNRVGLPGLGIFVALLLGAALEGVIGAMVSIPTAVLVTVLVDEYLVAPAVRQPPSAGPR